ncbi:SDR family oxidoreductase [Hyalangium minutum]|uniref:Oxidoreductase, short chain dehydrogenase/reductase family protein n=1 Tax=Hyalangium minutum TaxID=394096 RepID=A0A085WU68_9BACT|nr:SDR family oxidoreductase [Hyalangium minutum]KFE71231.1 Oxidoreductase, short chain dehydrogenase/reductase family protein [Hyalangium minutum]
MTPAARMDGKVCLVTGATNGIGLEAAKALAAQGATVVLAGRDKGRLETALITVRHATPDAKVESLQADFASLQDVRALAEAFKARYSRLDVLLNNAGLVLHERQVTKDGFEATFGINHLAPFLLTHLLMDVLKASGPARVVNVSSEAHRYGKLDFNDLQSERSYAMMRVYGTSKLANILFTQALARRLQGTQLTTNTLHPGVVRTGFGQNTQGWMRFAVQAFAAFFLTAEQGARTSVYLASSPEVEGVSGQYFIKCRPKKPSSDARNEQFAERLWQVSEELTGVKA